MKHIIFSFFLMPLMGLNFDLLQWKRLIHVADLHQFKNVLKFFFNMEKSKIQLWRAISIAHHITTVREKFNMKCHNIFVSPTSAGQGEPERGQKNNKKCSYPFPCAKCQRDKFTLLLFPFLLCLQGVEGLSQLSIHHALISQLNQLVQDFGSTSN